MKLRAFVGSEGWQGAHAANAVDTRTHGEQLERAPHCLQYFNYSPAAFAPPYVLYPRNSQRPQLGAVSWYKPVLIEDYGLYEPALFDWQLGPLLAIMPCQNAPSTLSKVKVGSLAGSGAAGIQPLCRQIVTFRGRT